MRHQETSCNAVYLIWARSRTTQNLILWQLSLSIACSSCSLCPSMSNGRAVLRLPAALPFCVAAVWILAEALLLQMGQSARVHEELVHSSPCVFSVSGSTPLHLRLLPRTHLPYRNTVLGEWSRIVDTLSRTTAIFFSSLVARASQVRALRPKRALLVGMPPGCRMPELLAAEAFRPCSRPEPEAARSFCMRCPCIENLKKMHAASGSPYVQGFSSVSESRKHSCRTLPAEAVAGRSKSGFRVGVLCIPQILKPRTTLPFLPLSSRGISNHGLGGLWGPLLLRGLAFFVSSAASVNPKPQTPNPKP